MMRFLVGSQLRVSDNILHVRDLGTGTDDEGRYVLYSFPFAQTGGQDLLQEGEILFGLVQLEPELETVWFAAVPRHPAVGRSTWREVRFAGGLFHSLKCRWRGAVDWVSQVFDRMPERVGNERGRLFSLEQGGLCVEESKKQLYCVAASVPVASVVGRQRGITTQHLVPGMERRISITVLHVEECSKANRSDVLLRVGPELWVATHPVMSSEESLVAVEAWPLRREADAPRTGPEDAPSSVVESLSKPAPLPDMRELSSVWDAVIGQERAKREITESVVWPVLYREEFEKLKLRGGRGMLMHGPPGCGKTLIARSVAKLIAKLKSVPYNDGKSFKWGCPLG